MPLYDLASRGGNETNKNQCYGEYDSTTKAGWGPAYQYACIHSDSSEYIGDSTTWYNYTLASAGTIYDENTTIDNPATNITKATESICPKGWTLPDKTQTRSIGPFDPSATYVSAFSSVTGGYYRIGTLTGKNTDGRWWGSTTDPNSSALRVLLNYNSTNLYSTHNRRFDGLYIRCVQAS